MAIIRLDCNLNGGDSVTPNNELFYRIYGDVDAYAAPIHTTGTALSDANVTVDNDNVIITGVDSASNTSVKISSVDAAGNEGDLSDAKNVVDNIFTNNTFEVVGAEIPNGMLRVYGPDNGTHTIVQAGGAATNIWVISRYDGSGTDAHSRVSMDIDGAELTALKPDTEYDISCDIETSGTDCEVEYRAITDSGNTFLVNIPTNTPRYTETRDFTTPSDLSAFEIRWTLSNYTLDNTFNISNIIITEV